jgi:hypothetical protein
MSVKREYKRTEEKKYGFDFSVNNMEDSRNESACLWCNKTQLKEFFDERQKIFRKEVTHRQILSLAYESIKQPKETLFDVMIFRFLTLTVSNRTQSC